jgi:hypothetical protein
MEVAAIAPTHGNVDGQNSMRFAIDEVLFGKELKA